MTRRLTIAVALTIGLATLGTERQALAQGQEFSVAVSRDAQAILNELFNIFGVTSSAKDGPVYKHFEPNKGGIDPVDDLARGFPGDKYRVVILTSAERKRIPKGNYNVRAVRQGRTVETEFWLFSPEAKAADEALAAHVAIPEAEHSFKDFFHDGFVKCVGPRGGPRPTMVDPHKTTAQLLVLKVWDGDDRYHDSVFARRVEEQWGKVYAIPFFTDAKQGEAIDKCLSPAHFKLRSGIRYDRVSTALNGVRLQPDATLHAKGLHAAVRKEDIELIAAAESDVDLFLRTLRSHFDRLLKATWNPDDKLARETVRSYGKVYRLLTNDDGVAQAMAQREYEYAHYESSTLEKLAPIKRIERSLARGELLPDHESRALENTLKCYDDYWRALREVRNATIDKDRLRARATTMRLTYVLAQYWTLARDVNEAEKLRRRARDEFVKLEAELKAVEGGAGALKDVRDTDDFDFAKQRYEDFKPRFAGAKP